MTHALILVGGKGERLRPYTNNIPKPLLPLGLEQHTLGVLLRRCAAEGFADITLAVGYQAGKVVEAIGDGSAYGVRVRYAHDPVPLGTAGPLVAMQDVPGPFLVINGDVLVSFSLRALYDFHRLVSVRGVLCTMATQLKDLSVDYGVVQTSATNHVISLVEKPRYSVRINLGVYACDTRLLCMIQPNQLVDFPPLLVGCMEQEDGRVMSYDVGSDATWHDIGTASTYTAASAAFLENPVRFGVLPCQFST